MRVRRKLAELLPHDLHNGRGSAEITIPSWAFTPDHWNTTFLRGLHKVAASWEFRTVWEIGVGTGVNLISLWNAVRKSNWYFSDYNAECVPLTCQNLGAAGIDAGYTALHGSTDLVAVSRGETPRADVIFGCLPQVPIVMDLEAGDRVAHYYNPERYQCSTRNACGLGLNEALLKRAKSALSPRGSVVLNLSGRPGLGRLQEMFAEHGYDPCVLHSAVVPQHPQTSLETLAVGESKGKKFEFFAHPEGAAITATEAEQLRVRQQPVFHRIYVIEGTRRAA